MKHSKPSLKVDRSRRGGRHGFALLVVIVCLTIVTLLILESLKSAMIQRRRLGEHEHRLQADWLAEAALNRAASRLAADAGYKGETWHIPASDIGGQADGEIVIRVDSLDVQPGQIAVEVQADYPAGSDHRVRRTKRVVMTKSSRKTQ